MIVQIIQYVLTSFFLLGSLFFLTISVVGLNRFPDFYCRNHAIGKSETLGAILMLCGLVIYNGLDTNSVKLLVIVVFIAIANPTATHVIARAAYRARLQPWTLSKRRVAKESEQSEIGQSVNNKVQDKRV